MSHSLLPHGLEPTRLLCPWNFPGKNTGVGLPLPTSGDLPNPGIKPTSLASPVWAGGFSTTAPPGKPLQYSWIISTTSGLSDVWRFGGITMWNLLSLVLFHMVKVKVKVKSLSRVWLFATLWTVAHQAPPSMGFSRQEHWSGLPFPSPLGMVLPPSFLYFFRGNGLYEIMFCLLVCFAHCKALQWGAVER